MFETSTEKRKPIHRTRKSVHISEYEEVLNLVRNTLGGKETELLEQAGYTKTNANKWRQADNVPLIALNALRGLLVDHKLKQEDARQPLKLSTDDIETLIHVLSRVDTDAVRRLRASLHKEIARRLES